MNFEEKSRHHYFFSKIWIAFTAIEFSIICDVFPDDKTIISQFINEPKNFEPARKYIGGYTHVETRFGENKTFQIYNFGPYPVDLLEFDDFKEIPIEDFKKLYFDILSDIPQEIKNEIEFIKFIGNTENEFNTIKSKTINFYQLLPPNWKYDEFSIFTLDYYLCGFAINSADKTLIFLQIDND